MLLLVRHLYSVTSVEELGLHEEILLSMTETTTESETPICVIESLMFRPHTIKGTVDLTNVLKVH